MSGCRPRWWAQTTQATRIVREHEPTCGLRFAITTCLDEDVAAVQYGVSDLVHGGIALAGDAETIPDWTRVDAESVLVEEDASGWTALHMPIPHYTVLDEETLAHAVAIAGAFVAMDDDTGLTVHCPADGRTGERVAAAREIRGYGTFAVRAYRRE